MGEAPVLVRRQKEHEKVWPRAWIVFSKRKEGRAGKQLRDWLVQIMLVGSGLQGLSLAVCQLALGDLGQRGWCVRVK